MGCFLAKMYYLITPLPAVSPHRAPTHSLIRKRHCPMAPQANFISRMCIRRPHPPPHTNKDVRENDPLGLTKEDSESTPSRLWAVLSFVPSRCRYDPNQPFEFSIGLNSLFGNHLSTFRNLCLFGTVLELTPCFASFLAFAACFTVANLYYTHPVLNLLAHDFAVTEYQSSYVPTLAQTGYASGLLFLCPLGDLLKRRPFVLWLVWFTATAWYVKPFNHILSPNNTCCVLILSTREQDWTLCDHIFPPFLRALLDYIHLHRYAPAHAPLGGRSGPCSPPRHRSFHRRLRTASRHARRSSAVRCCRPIHWLALHILDRLRLAVSHSDPALAIHAGLSFHKPRTQLDRITAKVSRSTV